MPFVNRLFCLLIAAASSCYSFSQNPEFGVFSLQDQNLKQVDFDKDADAVVLFDEASANYNDSYNLELTRRVRFKILKEKGIQRANIEIPFYSKDQFEYVGNVQAIVQTPDGMGGQTVKEINKADIFEQKLNSKVSVLKFALPNVKVGSIIEYKYTSICKNYGGLRDWYFQSDMPTLSSSFMLNVVPNAEFSYVVHKSQELPINIESDKNTAMVKFSMKLVPGLREEPYMEAAKDYLQYVEFQLAGYNNGSGSEIKVIETWNDVSTELMGETYFGRHLDKKLGNSETIISQANALAEVDKMKFIFDYVRKNFSWDGHKSIYAEDGIKTVWETKKGNSGEINLTLINLLKAAGLHVAPLLVSERSHGKVNTKFPMLDQFNKVVAYVTIGDEKFVLDATDQYTPVGFLPFDLLNTSAFVVDTKKGAIITLQDDSKTNWNSIEISSALTSAGTLSGKAMVKSSDYARVERTESAYKNEDKLKNLYFIKNNPSIQIDSFKVTNADNDSLSLDQEFKFSMPVVSNGDYKLINLNLFTELEKNPFISDNRFTNINFGARKITDVHERFVIPSNLKAELPKSVSMVTPDRSFTFTRLVKQQDNVVDVQFSVKINNPVFSASDYPMVKEYYKKMSSILNEPIVISNK